MNRRRKKSADKLLAHAVALFGNERRLALAIGVSQQSLNRAVRRGQVSPQLALGIHRVTEGRVGAHKLRPDIWRKSWQVPGGL